MFKRILVPIDGSRTAEAGLRTALRLAREHKSRVRLVHLGQVVVGAPYPSAGLAVSELFEAIGRTGKRLLERAAARCKAAGVRCDRQLYVAIADRASDVILKEAKRWRADLIVMGTHGRSGIARLALGSDAEQVVHAAQVPVLLVRARGRR